MITRAGENKHITPPPLKKRQTHIHLNFEKPTKCAVLNKIEINDCLIQATLHNPDMRNPDFRLNRTDWKVPVPSYTYNSYTHNPDLA